MGDLSHAKSFSLYDLGDLGDLRGSFPPEVLGILGVMAVHFDRRS